MILTDWQLPFQKVFLSIGLLVFLHFILLTHQGKKPLKSKGQECNFPALQSNIKNPTRGSDGDFKHLQAGQSCDHSRQLRHLNEPFHLEFHAGIGSYISRNRSPSQPSARHACHTR